MRSRLPLFLLFAILVFSANFETAAQVTGRVIEKSSGEPVGFAQVAILAQDSSIITGGSTKLSGEFNLQAAPGDYILKIVFVGFDNYSSTFSLTGNSLDLGDIALTKNSEILDEVVIEADLVRKPIEADIEGLQIRPDQTLSNAGGSVVDVLRNTPSVSVGEDGTVSIRGAGGTNILIDGRNSALGTDLEQIPASAVKSIKIINNPNSKYDAQAAGGIINIVLKKGEDHGAGGSAEVTGGTRGRFNGAVRGNMKKENYSLYGGYSYRYWPSVSKSWTERTIYNEDEFLRQDENSTRQDREHTLNLGSSYYFHRNTITYEGAFNAEEERSTETVRARIFGLDSGIEQLRYSRVNDEREENYTFDNALIYERDFADTTKEFRVVLSHSLRDNLETQDISAYNGNLSPENSVPTGLEMSANDELRQTFISQIDYAQDLWKGRLETGYKTTARAFDNDYDYLIRNNQTGEFENQENISNRFLYEEAVHAGYVMYGRKLGRLTLNGGVRAEWSLIETKLYAANEMNNQNYIDFFPSFQSLYEIDKKNAIKFTYSRRIDRPNGWRLNPFPDVTDTLNIRSGNPNLRPEYINSFEVGHLINWTSASLTYNLFYRRTTGLLDFLVRVEDGISYRRPENLNTGETYGAEIIGTHQPFTWWSFNGSFSFFRTEVDGTNIEGGGNNSGLAWNAKFTTDFDLPYDVDLQLTGNYTAPDIEAQGRDEARYYLDVSLQRSFMEGRMSASIVYRDIFDTRNFAGYNETALFRQEFERKRETSIVLLSLRYRL